MKYLDKPCPRCGNRTLRSPEKRGTGNRMTSLCFTCGKRAGYTINIHADGTQSYTIYPIGGIHPETKPKLFRLPRRLWNTSTAEVILALDMWRNQK